MKTKLLVLLLAGLSFPNLCSAQADAQVAEAVAQAIKPGKWTGSSVSPDGNVQPLTYDVTVAGASIAIVIHAGEHGDFTASEVRYDDQTITFTFTPRVEFHCALALNSEGAYAGECKGADGKAGQMTMIPPKE